MLIISTGKLTGKKHLSSALSVLQNLQECFMMLLSVFNQVVHYWLAETLCCCELTHHKVILSIVLPFPLQICQVTVHQSPAALTLAVFPLSFSLPKCDHFTMSQVFYLSRFFFFSIPSNFIPSQLFLASLPYTGFLPQNL